MPALPLPPAPSRPTTPTRCAPERGTFIGHLHRALANPEWHLTRIPAVQVFACMSAARTNPSAFSYPCNAWWLGQVSNPPRQPLLGNAQLNWAAQQKSNEMEAYNYFSHTSPNGQPFTAWIAASGFTGFPQGQNIAAGEPWEIQPEEPGRGKSAGSLHLVSHCGSVIRPGASDSAHPESRAPRGGCARPRAPAWVGTTRVQLHVHPGSLLA